MLPKKDLSSSEYKRGFPSCPLSLKSMHMPLSGSSSHFSASSHCLTKLHLLSFSLPGSDSGTRICGRVKDGENGMWFCTRVVGVRGWDFGRFLEGQ